MTTLSTEDYIEEMRKELGSNLQRCFGNAPSGRHATILFAKRILDGMEHWPEEVRPKTMRIDFETGEVTIDSHLMFLAPLTKMVTVELGKSDADPV